MMPNDFDTLSQALNDLNDRGFTEGFKAEETWIVGSFNSQKYQPEALKIVETHRFEGMTNPQDDSIVFAIEAEDGTKGTLVMSYSSEHNQNVELIKRIPSS